MAQCASPAGMGRKEGRMESLSRCRWCVATATFLREVRVCSVCKGEGKRLKGLCLLFYELGLYVGFISGRALLIVPEPASSVIPTLALTRGLGALEPGSSGLSQIQEICACLRY